MKIIKETESTKDYNGKTRINNYYYLVDDKNKLALPYGNDKTFDKLLDIELGNYDYLFNEKFLFTWSKRGMNVVLSPYFAKNPDAWIREIKIDDILKDD